MAVVFSSTSNLTRAGSLVSNGDPRPISASIWARPTSRLAQNSLFCNTYEDQTQYLYWELNSSGGNDVQRIYSGLDYAPSSSAFTLTAGRWTHLAFSWNTDNAVVYYRDGQAAGTTTLAYVFDVTAANTMVLGGICPYQLTQGAFYFSGALAEFAGWNAVLTPGEIARLAGGEIAEKVRKKSLVSSIPLWNRAGLLQPDLARPRLYLTANGTPTASANHPPVRRGRFALKPVTYSWTALTTCASTLAASLTSDAAAATATAAVAPASSATLAATPAIAPTLTATATLPPASTATLSTIVSTAAITVTSTATAPPSTSGSFAVTWASVIPVGTATAATPSTCSASLATSVTGAIAAFPAVANAPPASVGSLAMTTAATATCNAVAGDAGVDLATLALTCDGASASLTATAGLANTAASDLAGNLAGDIVACTATFLQSLNASATLAATFDGITGPLAATTPWRQPVRSKPASPRLDRRHPLARGLVAAWVYDRGAPIIPDRVGANPVTLTGTTAGSGPQGALPAFTGTASGSTTRSVGFERTQPFSVSLWVIHSQGIIRQVYLTNQAGGSGAQGWAVGYSVNAPGPNPRGIYLNLSNNKSGGNYLEQVGLINPVLGRPYHFTWTYDGTSSVVGVKLYADGYPLSKSIPTANNLTASSLNNASLLWAQDRNASSYNCSGLGDVLIWNRALSADEVAHLAADPVGPLRPRWKRFFLGIPQITAGTLTASVSGFVGYPAVTATTPPTSVASLTGPMFDLSAAGGALAAEPGIATATATFAIDGMSATATAEAVTPPASTATLSASLADTTASGTAAATTPSPSDSTGSATLTGISSSTTATATVPAPASASTAVTLGACSAAATATATTPQASIATPAVTLAGISAAATATATTPQSATATLSVTLAGASAAFTAVRALPSASIASASATLAGDTATLAATATDPPSIVTARTSALRLLRTHPRARNLVAAWCDPSGKLLLRDVAGLNPIALTGTTQGGSPSGTIHTFSSSASGDAARLLELARTQPFSVALTVSFDAISTRQVLVTNQSFSSFYTGWEVGFAPNLPGLVPGLYLNLSNNKFSGSYIEQGARFSPAIGRTYDGSGLAAGVRVYVDGLELSKPAASRDNLAGSTTSGVAPRLARDQMNANPFAGRLGDILLWTRTLGRAEVEADARDPFAPVRPRARRLFAGVSPSGTGLVALSLGSDTASATATATTPDPAVATLTATLADTTAAYAAVESVQSALSATLEDLTASGTAVADVPATADASLDVTFADQTAVALANQAVASLTVTTAGDTASFTSSPTIDAAATVVAQVNLGFNPLVGISTTTSAASAAAILTGTTAALTAIRALPPASSSTLVASLAPAVAAYTGTASPRSIVSFALAGTSASAAALASTPPSAAASLSAAMAPATLSALASALTPGTAIAATTISFAGAAASGTAIAQSASVGSFARTFSDTVTAATGTTAIPAPASSSIAVTFSPPVAAAAATHVPPAAAVATGSVTFAGPTATASAAATTPAASVADAAVSVGPLTAAWSAATFSATSAAGISTEDTSATFLAEATVPAASAAVGLVWLADDVSGLASGAYPPSPIRSTLSLHLAGTLPRYFATTTIVAEIRGRLRLERAWQQIRRLLGTHTLTLERIPEDIIQGQHGGPETTWEPVPGFGAIEAIVTMTEATIEDTGMARQGRRRGKILTRTPLPTLGPNYRFLFNDPYSGTRYLNCTPERNLAQAGELWAVGVEEYP